MFITAYGLVKSSTYRQEFMHNLLTKSFLACMEPYGINSKILQIQLEIMTNGPVEACFSVYEDFLHYKSGTLLHLLQ